RRHLAHAFDGREARLYAIVDEVAQGVRVVAARDLNDHRETAHGREIVRRDLDVGAFRLRARELRREAAQLELAHAVVRAALDLEREPPARAVDLAPRLLDTRQLADARLERQQDLALDDLGLRALAAEIHGELLA